MADFVSIIRPFARGDFGVITRPSREPGRVKTQPRLVIEARGAVTEVENYDSSQSTSTVYVEAERKEKHRYVQKQRVYRMKNDVKDENTFIDVENVLSVGFDFGPPDKYAAPPESENVENLGGVTRRSNA